MNTKAKYAAMLLVLAGTILLPVTWLVLSKLASSPSAEAYAGSVSCRPCHEEFYRLWASSRHGLAMQPYTAAFAAQNLSPQTTPVHIGDYTYLAQLGQNQGWVLEQGPPGKRKYPIAHVMGGKNVYYFLTSMSRGRLQVLPVAYDVHGRKWFDTAASGVRHFGRARPDSPLHWTDPFYTFNTSCHGCHVSQLSTNYDPATDSYKTTWTEPGINCQTCHGPGREHVELCLSAEPNHPPNQLKIISTGGFTAEQLNSMCASCHAKFIPLSPSFRPGERFFDHFDLVTLEHPDFYPDGRDLGENYTYTSWRMSRCAESGALACTHCHTSSGRYKFHDGDRPGSACLPCHRKIVDRPSEHSHHRPDSPGNSCVACHMPKSRFARMARSDHSMRPPVPAATLEFNSPNACNLCHDDKDAHWAQQHVLEWYGSEYQQQLLRQGRLVDAARRRDWTLLPQMLQYLTAAERDEVVAASLVRLLGACDSASKWPVIVRLLGRDSSPLVRSAAAAALAGRFDEDSLPALLGALRDPCRLVRVRAASSLAGVPSDLLDQESTGRLAKATAELLEGLNARPDDYACRYNLGNLHMARREFKLAASAFEQCLKLRPDYLPAHVNAAFAYDAIGLGGKAEASLRKALVLDPNSTPARLNLAMLLGQQGRTREAEAEFRKVLRLDPNSAVAAYNLAVILAATSPAEALRWSRRAYRLAADTPKYAYCYAFYLRQNGYTDQAVEVLEKMVADRTWYAEAYYLLGGIYGEQGQDSKAAQVYSAALENAVLSQQQRLDLSLRINRARRK